MSSETIPAMPREMVLASAGTGKTFRISSRIIGLLSAGAAPDVVFASTFTRKAAGEILDRVLERLAKAATDPAEARELAEHATLPGFPPPESSPEAWLALLGRLVRDLHRVNIGTLDSFFVRAATVFADELGLPPGWRLAEEPVLDRIRADGVHGVLSSGDQGAVLELVRAMHGTDATRSVHEGLLSRARALLDLHHALDPEAEDPWAGLTPYVEPLPDDVDERCERLALRFEAADVPETAAGTPMKAWQKEMANTAERLRARDWEGLVGSGLCVAARCEGGTYHRKPVPPAIAELFAEACALARSAVGARLVAQGRAMGRLAALLAASVDARQRETGAYGFSDLTRLIGGPDPIGNRPDLYYRLDARTQHILLDEFQDTSLSQWEALEPLLDELLSGYRTERAGVVVADPKQSIYAWRGGEPRLVRHVGDRYEMDEEGMHRSFRSSQRVLDVVNRVFSGIERNGAWGEDDEARAVASDWGLAFEPHEAVKPLPGYVAVHVGPADEGRSSRRPELCRRAAELVAELHRDAPARTIGVLTRKNATVARVMMSLRDLGIAASEEGGNPLTDSAAVASVLALLRLAEHPADLIARYHVAGTPVGEAIGFTGYADDQAAARLSHDVRRRLMLRGYGRTLAELGDQLADSCSPRERRRLDQLAELAFRYDERATLRITDFLRIVESERVEDPTTAAVRVMTVHQSKGLEFDIVVLPELDEKLEGGPPGAPPLAYRPGGAGRVTRAFPYVKKELRGLFPDVPELHAAVSDARAGALRDALSGLYVALTRARNAVHVVIAPDGEKGMATACTSSSIIRHALNRTAPAAEGDLLFEHGERDWASELARAEAAGREQAAGPSAGDAALGPAAGVPSPGPSVEIGPARISLRTGGSRTRGFARRAPSELAAGSKVDLRMILNLRSGAALEGTIAHAWMELIGWIDEGAPSEEELRATALAIEPRLQPERLDALLERWRSWLAHDGIRQALSRDSYGPDAVYEREVRFIHRDEDAVLEGAIDRLVLQREGGRVVGAVIIDYKTDAIEASDEEALTAKAAMYRPQLDAYRRAVASWYRIPRAAVKCRLVVLEAGSVLEV